MTSELADIQQRHAHESPVIFYSLVIGFAGECDERKETAAESWEDSVLTAGPALVFGVPPIRKSMGWKPAERVPTTDPSEFALTVDGVRLFSPPPSYAGCPQ